MQQKNVLIKGTLILTIAGLLSRVLGFYNRIFLSQFIGAKEVGIYQLIFPIYALSFSICCQGIQTAISKMTATYSSSDHQKYPQCILMIGTAMALFVSLILAALLFTYSDLISLYVLKEESCSICLKLASFAIPFVAVKSCYIGYSYGKKQSFLPASTQLMEQIIRVGSIYLMSISFYKDKTATASAAVLGMVLGEILSSFYLLLVHFIQTRKDHCLAALPAPKRQLAAALIKDSIPLTSNRLALTLFQSTETILIPTALCQFYGSQELSLEIYGILTGMALPFLLFPSAITNSLSVMLLPTIAEAKASGQKGMIEKSVSKSIQYCLLIGILCAFLFLFYGKSLGNVIFHNKLAGEFMLMLCCLCPFIYVTSALSSILNGLGQTKRTLLHNIISLSVRILFILFVVPLYGLKGYLWALLLGDLILILLDTHYIRKETAINFNVYDCIVKPVLLAMICGGISLLPSTSSQGYTGIFLHCGLYLGLFIAGCLLVLDLVPHDRTIH